MHIGRCASWLLVSTLLWLASWQVSAQATGAPPAGASCVVSAGNRNAPLAADGTYTIFGIPGNLGAIRARATCSDGSYGQSTVGFTNPFQPDTITLGPIAFGQLDPVPVAAALTAPERHLSAGATSQLTLTAVGADGGTHDATPRSAGTVYAVSNLLLAAVSENGLVRIFSQFAEASSARLVVSATTEGSVSSTYVYVLGPRGRIAGNVLRADGANVGAGVQVTVLRLQPREQAGSAVTDASGAFVLDDVSAGAFLISAIDPATGDRGQATARIAAEGETATVALRLGGQGQVRVGVVDTDDASVAGAAVTLTTLGARREIRTAATDAQGVATFAAVAAGDFTVSVRDPATRLVASAVAKLAAGQELALTLALQPVGQVQGRVFDVDGATLRPGTQVRILSRARGILTQAVVGEDAAFRFDTLPISDGPFTLDAFVDGRLRARVPGIVIAQADDTVARDVTLGAVGIVEGRVRDAAGATFAGARVTMQSLVGLRLFFDAVTDEEGVFVLPAVPLGAFELTAVTTEGRSGRAQGRIAVDGDTVERDVVIADNTVVGTVYARDGATPVGAGIMVYLAPRSLGTRYSYLPLYTPGGGLGILRTTTDEGGRFAFPVETAGDYYVQAEDGPERGRSEIVLVNLDPSQPLEARVVFLAKGTVHGTVRDATGALQADVPVIVRSNGAFASERAARTDTQGRYTVDGVFAGDIATTARNEISRLAGVASGRLDSEGESVRVDVTLAASGAITGRVLRRDGSVVPGLVRLVASRNGSAFATLALDNGAAYRIDLAPIGDIELVAEEAATGDLGVAITRIATGGEERAVDVRLVGQGRLRVRAVDAAGQAVHGAQVTVTTSRPFATSATRTTDPGGFAVFERVFAGDYTINAGKAAPVGSMSGSAAGTLLPGADTAVDVTLTARAIGSVKGVVFESDGITPARAGIVVRRQPQPFGTPVATVTDAQGRYRFENVEAGTYAIEALYFADAPGCPSRDRIRGRTPNVVLASAGEEVTANVQLIGSGRISGRVSDAAAQPVSGIEVRVMNPDPVYGPNVTCNGRNTYDRVTDAQGEYRIEDAPPGDFTVTAENVARTLRAEGRGRIGFDGDAAVVDLVLVDNAVSMPRTLHDANGFGFDVAGNGSIARGYNDVFAGVAPDTGGMRLELERDSIAVPFQNGNGSIGRLVQEGQALEVDDATPSGLVVTRRVYVPRAGYFTRYLETLRNDTAQPIAVRVRATSHHRQGDSNPRIVDTSDGDAVLSVFNAADPDRWAVVDDQSEADPFASASITATAHVFDGSGATLGVETAAYELVAQTGRLTYAWDVVVEPGASVSLMHFVLHQLDRARAREAATRLMQLPPEAIDGLTTDERRAILNFAVPDQSDVTPLPNLDAGVVFGRVYSGDGATPLAGAQVRFRSLHPLFGRVRQATSDAAGDFAFRSLLDGTANNAVIPVHGFELDATHPRSGAATSLAIGEFDAGQVQERQDLVFNGRGDVRGTVKRHNGAPVDGADVRLCRINNFNICTNESPNPSNYDVTGVDGRYYMAANTPRVYYLFARKAHPQSSGDDGLTSHGMVTVTAGDVVVADLTIDPTGSVAGVVRTTDGRPVVDAVVALHRPGAISPMRAMRSDTAGGYRLFDVPVGEYRVSARDAISLAAGSADVAVTVDAETERDITLAGFGALTVQVNFARGVPAPRAGVGVSGHGVATADDNGVAQFQLAQGEYVVGATHPDNTSHVLAGSSPAIIAAPGEQAAVTVTLGPAGAVRGTIVRPDGTTLAGGFPYTVRQISGSGGFSRSLVTNATGAYRTAGLPLGSYVITAYDAQQDRFADAEFAIAADGEERTVDLVLRDNRIALPADLRDANRFVYDVQRSGALRSGSGAFVDAGLQLTVGGVAFTGDSSARLEAERRQFAITQPAPVAGLTVTRKVYVPRGAYFARYLDVLENPTAAPITVDVDLASRFALDSEVFATSSGDAIASTADRWAVLDDDVDEDVMLVSGQSPPVAHVFAGDGATLPQSVATDSVGGKAGLALRWNGLVVPAGGKVTLLHFAVQQVRRAGARAAAERLVQLPPEALADLAEAEAATIVNFAVPAGLASTLEPLPSLTSSVRGMAWEGDLRTPVRAVRVTVQSAHPLFNRVWGRQKDWFCFGPSGTPVSNLVTVSTLNGGIPNPPPVGSWSLEGRLTADDSIVLPEGVDMRVTAQEASTCYSDLAGHSTTRYPSRVATAAAPAVQDVVFDTAVITGTVNGDTDYSITAGRVYRSIDSADGGQHVPIAADGSYAYPGIPQGRYDILFDTPPPNATWRDGSLRGAYKAVDVLVGDIKTVELPMQATSTVDGAVVTANGEPARDVQLTLHGEAAAQEYDQCATGCVAATLAANKGRRAVERLLHTDSLGRYRFIAVPNGSYTLTALDPVSGGRRVLDVAVAGQPVVVPITLLETGSAVVTLVSALGNAVVDAPVHLTVDGNERVAGRTDAQGRLTVANIPRGNYSLRIDDPRYPGTPGLQRSVAGTITTGGQENAHTVTLLAAVRLAVTVQDGDAANAPVANAWISVVDAFGQSRGAATDAQGRADLAPVPQGAYTLRAQATIGGVPKEEMLAGSVAPADDDTTRTATLVLRDSFVSLPRYLYDANRRSYLIDSDGAGYALPDLYVGGMRFTGADRAREQLGRRALSIAQAEPLQGLNIQRQAFVPRNGYFVRYLDILENRGSAPVEADVRLVAPRNYANLADTSSGDGVLDSSGATPDRWFTLLRNGEPAWTFVASGAGAALAAPRLSYEHDASIGSYAPDAVWSRVVVPVGGRVALLHFTLLQRDVAAARASAERLSQLPPEALEGIDPALAASVANFAVPADVQSTLAPLPSLEGTLSGVVREGDGATVVPGASVRVDVVHPLFGNTFGSGTASTLRTDVTGTYALNGTLGNGHDAIALPLDAVLKITADHPASPMETTAETNFAPGSDAIVQDLTFASGEIRGKVVGAYAYPPPLSGYVTVYLDGVQNAQVDIAGDGTFRVGGLAAGAYRLDAVLYVPGGGYLQGVADGAVVTTGQATGQDVTLQPNGAVNGRVLGSDGVPVASINVRLAGENLFRATNTDAQGAFSFSAVPTGTHQLQVTDPRSQAVVTTPVTISADATVTRDLVLASTGVVTITALYANGSLAPNAALYALAPNLSGPRYLGRTGANGTLAAELAVGPYVIQAYHPVSGSVSETPGEVPVDGMASTLDVRLKANANLRVRVVDADAANAPLATVRVHAKSPGDSWWNEYVTDATGSVTLTNRAEGSHLLRALSADGRLGMAVVAVDSAVDGETADVAVAATAAHDVVGGLRFATESHLYDVAAEAGERLAVAINAVPFDGLPDDCPVQATVYAPDRTPLALGYGYGARDGYLQYPDTGDLFDIVVPATAQYTIAVTPRSEGCEAAGYRLAVRVDGAPGAVQAPAEGRVRVRVLRRDGATPFAGVAVRLRNEQAPHLHIERVSGADGIAVFEGVPAGHFVATSVPRGGSTQSVQATGDVIDMSQPVDVDLVMPAETTLSLRALDSAGVSYAKAMNYKIYSGDALVEGSTDADGEAEVAVTGTEPVRVVMTDRDDRTVQGAAMATPVDAQTVDVPVTVGRSIVEGRVLDYGGAPVDGSWVTVYSDDTGEWLGSAYTQLDGSYRVDPLPGAERIVLDVAHPVSGVKVTVPVALGVGQVSQQDLRLPQHGTIAGTVKSANGRPLAGATLEMFGEGIHSQYTTTDVAGAYRYAAIPIDVEVTVIARVHAQGSGQGYSDSATLALDAATPDATRHFTLTVPGASVVFRTLAADGRDVNGDCYYALGSSSGSMNWSTQSACATATSLHGLPPGDMQARLHRDGIPHGPLAVTAIENQNATATFAFSVVRGVVRYADGTASPSSDVRLRDSEGVFHYTTTDAVGAYRVTGAAPGAFEVTASDFESGLAVMREGVLADISVPVVIDIDLPATGTVEGTVFDAAGTPVGFATVYAVTEVSEFDRTTQADEDGHYDFGSLPLGTVALSALHPMSSNVAVGEATLSSPDQITTADLHFPQPGRVTGTVMQADGSVAAEACVTLWSTAEARAYLDFSLTTTADAQGRYEFDTVAPGPVSVFAPCGGSNGGIAAGTVASGSETTLDIRYDGATSLPVEFDDATWSMSTQVLDDERLSVDGVCQGRSEPTVAAELFDGERAFGIVIDGRRPRETRAAVTSMSGREIRFAAMPLGDVVHARRVFAPSAAGYVRVFDTLGNPTSSELTVRVDIEGRAYPFTSLVVEPAGTGGRFAIHADAGAITPPTRKGRFATHADAVSQDWYWLNGYVFGGTGGDVPDRFAMRDQGGAGWGWTVTIPPGQTVGFVAYYVARCSESPATARATLEALADMATPGMFDGLSAADKANIKNFQVPP